MVAASTPYLAALAGRGAVVTGLAGREVVPGPGLPGPGVGNHNCAIKTGHTVWCWGDNGNGQLGDGTTTGNPVPVQVSGHATDWAAVSDGLGHTCAVKTDGTVWCWGWNIDGQLGDGTTTDSPFPVQVSGM
jgi:alpha-tubulin suppressor-like RCC1 family protein